MSANIQNTDRDKLIVRTSLVGIVTNILLAGFKAAVGFVTGSIAIILDAVNNLSDVLSSAITIIGAKLAGKSPDKEHPMGHGRAEYLSALVVAAIILYAGITSATEAVKKILSPQKANYNAASIIIISVAIIVKIVLGRYVTAKGRLAKSGALEASGKDALNDAMISVSVLASALIFIFTGLALEAYVGLAISVMIVKSGIEMTSDTLDDILGRRADPEVVRTIKRLLTEEPEVRGAYDLFLYNYGPDRDYCSVHLELPDTMTVEEVDVLTRKVQMKVFSETGVVLTGVGVYSFNTRSDEIAEIRNKVQKTVLSHEWALQLHAFYADTEAKTMRFDVVMSFDITHKEGLEILQRELKELYPDYTMMIAPDIDISG
ncbi:MAG: cation diffusion facilitator family transporter [Ruminococcus sp.]|nr:cation diffusion facilitator family transporter [Ruminococcus sp.]